MHSSLSIVLPVFNDWPSFFALLRDLDTTAGRMACRLSVIVVDDGSTEPGPGDLYGLGPLPNIDSVLHVRLAVNLGHQRALAIGICVALEDPEAQRMIIMDADGEDRPQDIASLVASADAAPNCIIAARRRRRSETFAFRMFYKAYKSAFVVLTGKEISFGNFSLLSREDAMRLSMVSDLWNNLPAAIMRSRIPIKLVPIDRGRRYFGSSKMSFVQLSLHGMSAYSVYTDAILVRLLIATFVLGFVGAGIAVCVSILRLFTTHTTPGWATTVIFGTAIIVSQATFSTLMAALLLLNNRSQRLLIPAIEAVHYVRSRTYLAFYNCEAAGAPFSGKKLSADPLTSSVSTLKKEN
jgi:glycosyltransferase involved in cell wall biosynthesis